MRWFEKRSDMMLIESSCFVFLQIHDGLGRDHHSPLREAYCLIRRHHKGVSVVLLFGLVAIVFSLTWKRILCAVISLFLHLLPVSLQNSYVLRIDGRHFREIEALSGHFWLIKRNAPQHRRWSQNLLDIIRPKHIVLIRKCVLKPLQRATEREPSLNHTISTHRLNSRHVIVNLKKDIRWKSKQCETNRHI